MLAPLVDGGTFHLNSFTNRDKAVCRVHFPVSTAPAAAIQKAGDMVMHAMIAIQDAYI